MKNIKAIIAGTLLLMGISHAAHADLVQADHLTTGDQLAVYDTVTDLTWLDLTVTQTLSYDDAGLLSGYRYATLSEVTSMLESYFNFTIAGSFTQVSGALTTSFNNLFGVTLSGSTYIFSRGLVDRGDGTIANYDITTAVSNGFNHIFHSPSNDAAPTRAVPNTNIGTFLVRSSESLGGGAGAGDVNSPATLGATLLAGAAFLMRRKRI